MSTAGYKIASGIFLQCHAYSCRKKALDHVLNESCSRVQNLELQIYL